MAYKVITDAGEINRESWEEFLSGHPDGNFFQSPGYYDLYGSLNSLFEPVGIFAADDKGKIAGILIAVIMREKGIIAGKLSGRCIIYGGPVVKDGDAEITDLLLKGLIKKVKGKSIYIELRNLFDLSRSREKFLDNGFEFHEHLNFILELSTPEENMAKLNQGRRRQIKKSRNAGAEIVEAKDLEEIKEFYRLLQDLYKEKVRKPLPDFIFFKKFFETPSLGKYFLVKHEGKIIGANLCPFFKDTVYELYRSGLDKDYKDLYPSVLATWAPIEYAAEKGFKKFDFLGAGSPEKDNGVREFKSKFGGELVSNGRFTRINNNLLYNAGKLGLKLYQMMKSKA